MDSSIKKPRIGKSFEIFCKNMVKKVKTNIKTYTQKINGWKNDEKELI